MNSEIKIRVATVDDAAILLDIYAPYVNCTAISFEYKVPSVDEFVERIKHVQAEYPFLVAEYRGSIVGYTYAARFSERAAYDWSVETSIYVKADIKRVGVGSTLYNVLEAALQAQGILTLIACIAYPDQADEYLSHDSILFHKKQGYSMAGKLCQCGYKFNRWYDLAWMQKRIGTQQGNQSAIKKFNDICHLVKEIQ